MRTQTQKTQNSTKAKPVSSQRSSTQQYSHPVIKLQQQIGNQAVQRLLQSRRIQAKLTIGAPNDKYEQEADRLADHVMRIPDSTVAEQSHENLSRQTPVIQRMYPELQRQSTDEIEEEEEETLLQAKEMPGHTPEVNNELEGTINSLRGGGEPLSNSVRSYMEPRFGRDFSGVRVHTDTRAASVARSINASAFTRDKDIVFSSGHYSPQTGAGKRLLAHELTHVIQQSGDEVRRVQCLKKTGNESTKIHQRKSKNDFVQRQARPAAAQPLPARPVGGGPRADRWGNGNYGARRVRRGVVGTHEGLDLQSTPGDAVNSPVNGTVVRRERPYRGDTRYNGVIIRELGTGRLITIYYVNPSVTTGNRVTAGQQIGVTQDLSLKYPRHRVRGVMTNHIHLQVEDGGARVNPAPILPP